jgi:DNA-binding transcriptional LysR family regulator
MTPTPLAETLERPVRTILSQIEETILARAEFDAAADVRTFRVLATDYTALVFIRSLVSSLERVAPGIRLRLEPGGLEDPGGRLQRGEIDLAIVPTRFSEPTNLPSQPLFTDRFVAVAWRGNAEVSDPLTWDEFHKLPYLSYRLGSVPSMVDALLEELGHGRQLDAVVEGFVVGALLIRGTRQITFSKSDWHRPSGRWASCGCSSRHSTSHRWWRRWSGIRAPTTTRPTDGCATTWRRLHRSFDRTIRRVGMPARRALVGGPRWRAGGRAWRRSPSRASPPRAR